MVTHQAIHQRFHSSMHIASATASPWILLQKARPDLMPLSVTCYETSSVCQMNSGITPELLPAYAQEQYLLKTCHLCLMRETAPPASQPMFSSSPNPSSVNKSCSQQHLSHLDSDTEPPSKTRSATLKSLRLRHRTSIQNTVSDTSIT